MGNSLALLMLLVWPVVTAVLFARLDYRRAAIWTLLAGYLLLPPVSGIKIPMVPYLQKDQIASLCALVGMVMLRQSAPMPWIRMEAWVKMLLGLAVVGVFATVATNPEPLIEGVTFRPGLGVRDAINALFYTLLELAPFVIGYMLLSSTDSIRLFMQALILATLGYSILMLIEIRMSPQLNVWIYGFFAHDFSQSIRYGGFRPMVFLEHGLWVAMFTVMGLLSAAVAFREAHGPEQRRRAMWVLGYLMILLVLCKSAASLGYSLLFVPAILLLKPQWQLRIAGTFAALVFIYPLALWLGLVPTEAITDAIISYDPDRGHSLRFRFNNEQILLQHAAEKILAGWGGWGRNLLVNPEDGRYTTIADGQWIITITGGGLIAYVAVFGLFCGTILRVWRHAAATGRYDRWAIALSLICVANLIDLIPNATLTPLTWLAAGALAGMTAREPAAAPQPQVAGRVTSRPPVFQPIIG